MSALDERLLKGLTISIDELVGVCLDHWSGPADDKPCRRCGVVLCPSYRTAQPLASRRRFEARRIPDEVRDQLKKPLPPPPNPRRRGIDGQEEELFDSAPFVDLSKKGTRGRPTA